MLVKAPKGALHLDAGIRECCLMNCQHTLLRKSDNDVHGDALQYLILIDELSNGQFTRKDMDTVRLHGKDEELIVPTSQLRRSEYWNLLSHYLGWLICGTCIHLE